MCNMHYSYARYWATSPVFHRVLVNKINANKGSQSTLYVKDVTAMHRGQVRLLGNDYVMFHLVQEDKLAKAVFLRMTTYYVGSCHKEMKKEFMGSHDSKNVRVEKNIGKEVVYEFVYLTSDKMVMTLRSTSLVSYPTNTIHLNSLVRRKQ